MDVTLDDYLGLLDMTGRMIREGKRGAIPEEFAPIVERLQLDASRWVETVRRYGSFYHHVAGQFERISEVAKSLGKRWLCVTSAAREHGTYRNDPRPQPCEAFG